MAREPSGFLKPWYLWLQPDDRAADVEQLAILDRWLALSPAEREAMKAPKRQAMREGINRSLAREPSLQYLGYFYPGFWP